MTPPAGNIRADNQGGLRVDIEGVEHLITRADVAYLLGPGAVALLQDPDPCPLLIGEPRRRTGHVLASRYDGDEIPHLVICVHSPDLPSHPGRLYLAQTVEVREVWAGRLDICKVVSV